MCPAEDAHWLEGSYLVNQLVERMLAIRSRLSEHDFACAERQY